MKEEELDALKVGIHFKENSIPSVHRGLLTEESVQVIQAYANQQTINVLEGLEKQSLYAAFVDIEYSREIPRKAVNVSAIQAEIDKLKGDATICK